MVIPCYRPTPKPPHIAFGSSAALLSVQKRTVRPVATTFSTAFSEFRSSLELTSTQRALANQRKDRVKTLLGAEWLVSSVTFGGSYGRATKVRAPADGKSDIDVFVVLDPSHRSAYGMWGKNPVDLLADIKATLIKTLTTPSVRRDAPAVRINYSDMVIDVVPAFARLDGRLDIPMGTGWLVASPVQQAARFTSRNAACSNNFKPLVKMGKYWLSQRVSLPMRSYHFECLAYESFEGRGIESIRDSVPYLFEQLAWRVEYFVHDPGGSGTDVAAYMSGTARANAAGMFRRAGESANAAIATPTMEAEISAWRSLFGPRFPRYG